GPGRPRDQPHRGRAVEFPDDVPALQELPKVRPLRVPHHPIGCHPPKVAPGGVEQVAGVAEEPEVLPRPPIDQPHLTPQVSGPGLTSPTVAPRARRGARFPEVERARWEMAARS